METLTSFQIEEYKEAFDLFDKDGDGVIDTQELDFVLRALGIRLNSTELQEMIAEVDEDGNGTIDFHEFLSMLTKKLKESDAMIDVINTFKIFDKDGNGCVSTAELRYILTSMGEKLDKNDVDDLLNECDVDGDGNIYCEEFLRGIMFPKEK